MREFILITAMALASATAQAADRSLTLGSDTPVAAPARAADTFRVAETPLKPAEATTAVETPNANETPKYVERPALVEPKTEQPKAEVKASRAGQHAIGQARRPQDRVSAEVRKATLP